MTVVDLARMVFRNFILMASANKIVKINTRILEGLRKGDPKKKLEGLRFDCKLLTIRGQIE